MNEADAIVKKAMHYCDALPICDYYMQLSDQSKQNNLKNRNDKVKDSYTTMDTCYTAVCSDNSIIYSSFFYEKFRIVLTRWRLSSIDINIEKGCHQNIPRHRRLC